jgi:hypothetical protein
MQRRFEAAKPEGISISRGLLGSQAYDDLPFGVDPVGDHALPKQLYPCARGGRLGANRVQGEFPARPTQRDRVEHISFGGEADILGAEGLASTSTEAGTPLELPRPGAAFAGFRRRWGVSGRSC